MEQLLCNPKEYNTLRAWLVVSHPTHWSSMHASVEGMSLTSESECAKDQVYWFVEKSDSSAWNDFRSTRLEMGERSLSAGRSRTATVTSRDPSAGTDCCEWVKDRRLVPMDRAYHIVPWPVPVARPHALKLHNRFYVRVDQCRHSALDEHCALVCIHTITFEHGRSNEK
jgi:hypothetical protein